MKKQNNNLLILIACILSYVAAVGSVLVIVFVAFDILGMSTLYQKILLDTGYTVSEVNSSLIMLYLEFGFAALLNIYFANFYLKGLKYKIDTPQYGKSLITQAILQMLLASAIPGVFALIAGFKMNNKQVKPTVNDIQKSGLISDYKLELMKQSISRLKELREKGVISEEEYYANLNKILEG